MILAEELDKLVDEWAADLPNDDVLNVAADGTQIPPVVTIDTNNQPFKDQLLGLLKNYFEGCLAAGQLDETVWFGSWLTTVERVRHFKETDTIELTFSRSDNQIKFERFNLIACQTEDGPKVWIEFHFKNVSVVTPRNGRLVRVVIPKISFVAEPDGRACLLMYGAAKIIAECNQTESFEEIIMRD